MPPSLFAVDFPDQLGHLAKQRQTRGNQRRVGRVAPVVHRRTAARGGEPRPGFPEFHRLQLEDFVQAIREGRDPAVTGAEAKKALEIILAIYESTRTGLPVKLPLAG